MIGVIGVMNKHDELTVYGERRLGNYKILIRERLRLFDLDIILLSTRLPSFTFSKMVGYQLTKSDTSVYANYRAA